MDNERFRVSLENGSFSQFVLRQYQRITHKEGKSALEFIIERWALLDPHAEAYGITLGHFEREKANENVSPINKNRPRADGGKTG